MTIAVSLLRAGSCAFAFTVALACGSPFGGTTPGTQVFSSAEARVGRPATPMSYAGVARRTTRRAAVAGAAAAGATYHYYAGPGCVQAVNSFGQLVYRCP